MPMPKRLRRLGIATTELAVLAPILALLLFGTHDVAQVMLTSLRLERAARTGAQFALAKPQDLTAVRNAVLAAAPGLTLANVPMPVQSCECASSPASCSATCPGGLVRVITVVATQTLTPLLLTNRTQGVGNAVVRLR